MKLLLFCGKGSPIIHYAHPPPCNELKKNPAELGPSAPTSMKELTSICCNSSGLDFAFSILDFSIGLCIFFPSSSFFFFNAILFFFFN